MVYKFVLVILLSTILLYAKNCDSLVSEIEDLKTQLEEVKIVLQSILDGKSVETVLPEAKARLEVMAREKAMYDSLMSLTYEIPIGQSQVLGPKEAPVTIIEFSDFACPYCFEASQELERLVTDFPDKVRIVFKHFPLPSHNDAPAAHKASLAAAQLGKFWEYRFILPYKYDHLSPKILLEGASMVGLRKRSFKKALAMVDTSQIQEDVALGSILSVDGTPTFFVNGKRYPHFSYENIVNEFNLIPKTDKAVKDSSCNCDTDD